MLWHRPPPVVNVYNGATGSPVDGSPAPDLAALESRVAALESDLGALRATVDSDHAYQLAGLHERMAGQYRALDALERRVAARGPGRPRSAPYAQPE